MDMLFIIKKINFKINQTIKKMNKLKIKEIKKKLLIITTYRIIEIWFPTK